MGGHVSGLTESGVGAGGGISSPGHIMDALLYLSQTVLYLV